jgi:hypothetical protein
MALFLDMNFASVRHAAYPSYAPPVGDASIALIDCPARCGQRIEAMYNRTLIVE